MVEVTAEFVDTSFSEFTDFRVLEFTVGIRAVWKELANRRVGSDAY